MPDGKRSPKEAVIFALAIVKNSVISNRKESSKVEAALQKLFPEVSFTLVAEDDSSPAFRRRQALSKFAGKTPLQAIPSSKISAN